MQGGRPAKPLNQRVSAPRRGRGPGDRKRGAKLAVAAPSGLFPVPPPPKSLSAAERDVWIELAARGINPSRLATFRSLVTCTATMRRPGLKPSTLSALLRTAERLRATIEAAPPAYPRPLVFLPIDDPEAAPSWRAYLKRCSTT